MATVNVMENLVMEKLASTAKSLDVVFKVLQQILVICMIVVLCILTVLTIVKKHLSRLGKRQYNALSRLLGVSVDELLSGKEELPAVRVLPPEQRKDPKDMLLRITVDSADGDKIRIFVE